MAKPSAEKLRVYAEQPPEATWPQIATVGSLPELLSAFQTATGWSLQYVAGPEPRKPNGLTWSAPVNPGVGVPLGHLRLDPAGSKRASSSRRDPVWLDSATSTRKPVDMCTARAMASAVAGLLGELIQTRRALWQREADLAAGVPLVAHPEEEKHLAERLRAVLKGGAEAVGCQAAALYLLDEATTQLKLRSCWGLPFDRLTAPARRLRGAIADLEALLGHAVVLDDADLMRYWEVPEDFAAAVCVPVSTPTTLLGTLWVYSVEKRGFDDHQTNILEMVAGRLAADRHRAVLMREGVDAAELKKQVAAAERLQRNQMPTISPLLDGWELAGWTAQSEAVGGDFHDWFCLPNGLLAAAVGHAMHRGLEAALSAGAVKAALRAHAQYHREAEQTIKQLNLTLWTGSAGDQSAALFLGLIETGTGRVCYCSAGRPSVVAVRPDGWESLSHPCPPLGEGPDTEYEQFGYELRPGEALVSFTDGVRDAVDPQGRPLGEGGLAEPLVGRLNLSAEQLAAVTRRTLDAHAPAPDRNDRTVLVIKRTKA